MSDEAQQARGAVECGCEPRTNDCIAWVGMARKRILIGVPLVGMASGRTRADARVLTQCVQKTIVARSFARYAAP